MTAASLGKILIVDGDENIVDLLHVNLDCEGYAVASCATAAAAARLDLSDVRLVIADAMEQSFSGLDLLRQIKSDPMKAHVGFILCTPDEKRSLVIDALDAGADDYVVKPFSLRELIARVKSVIRRHDTAVCAPGKMLTFKSLVIDLVNRKVTDDGMLLSLSKTEYAILVLLMKNIDSYLTRAEIHKLIWSDTEDTPNDRIVDTNISRLRKKLGEIGANIVNRSGFGYTLTTNEQN